MLLVVIILGSTDREHFHYGRKFYWWALPEGFYQDLRIINVEECNLSSKDDDELAGTYPLFLSNRRRAWEETIICSPLLLVWGPAVVSGCRLKQGRTTLSLKQKGSWQIPWLDAPYDNHTWGLNTHLPSHFPLFHN